MRVELPADPPPIEGVSTSTVGFVGQTLRGPTEPGLVTSWPEFARSYGGLTDPGSLSYLPFAVKGFFDNGGRRAYIARVTPPAGSAGRATPLAAAASLDDFLGAAATGDRSGTGLRGLATIDEISLLAVPDEVHPNVRADVRAGIRDAVIAQSEQLLDRFAILSLGPGAGGADPTHVEPLVRTSRAAVYFPWVRVRGPASRETCLVPPHGHVAGLYARIDLARGVHTAPANAVVRGIAANDPDSEAVSVTRTSAQVQDLNRRGVNVIRDLRAQRRGIRVWGARTLAADGEWKYVNVRRLFIYLERSIDEGTRWAVFEPNEEATWRRLRQSVSDFLTTVWRDRALVGVTAEEAFFVRCDRTTMTQDDIDDGRLVAIFGAAPRKPAEFVVVRFGHQTSVDAR